MHTTARVNELKCVSLAKSLKALNHNLKVSSFIRKLYPIKTYIFKSVDTLQLAYNRWSHYYKVYSVKITVPFYGFLVLV